MNPQLSLTPSRALFALLFFFLILFAPPVWSAPPTCTSVNINPGANDPVAIVVAATSPGAVSVVDLATNTVVCSIAVGNGPSHLAFSADSSLLLVENDADATVSVINLADGSTAATLNLNTLVTPGTSGVTGNIAATYDGTHSFAYVAVTPSPFSSSTVVPVLARINLDVSPPTLTSIGSLTAGTTAPANGDIGISFLPDGSKAYITFDGNTNVYTTTLPDTFSASISVTGGSFAVSPVGDLGYVVQTAATAASASPNQINLTANTAAATTAAGGQTICSRSNTITTSPDGTVAYYSCPANNSLQFITASTNQVTNTVNLKTAGSGPNGIAATSDGSSLVVANNNATISIFTALTSTAPTEMNFAGPGGALAGVGQRLVRLTISPTTPTIKTTATQQFIAGILYAFRTNNLIWSVDGNPGGNATVGAISATGLYTPPSTAGNHTISVFSPEIPLNSKLYPGQNASTTITVVLPITVSVTPKPSSLNLSTATTLPFTATVANDPANKGVTWTVNGVTPGTTTTGTISPTSTASGAPTTYTAPKMISPPPSAQVTATSVSDPTASDTSTLTLSSSITFNPIAFNPAAPLLIENPDTLSTSLTGDPYNQGVTWSINGCSAATPATSVCGSINASTGLFTPPPIVPYASQSNPVSPATVTFSATSVTDSSKSSVTNPTAITSNVSITGFQVNGAAPPPQLLIENAYALTVPPTLITGDTGQGVTWTIVSCPAENPALKVNSKCGSITAGGAYTPPKIVPYDTTVAITPSSVATITFLATSVADPLVSKPFPINIGSTVAIAGYNLMIGAAAASPPLLIENQNPAYSFTPVISGDTGQGVTWTIVSCSAENPALKVNSKCGSITAGGAYTPPKIVPYDTSVAITPTSTASINFQAVSIADPKVVFQPAAIAVGSTVAIAGYEVNGAAPPAQLLIETPTYALSPGPFLTGDTGQGVTWTILSCSAENPALTTNSKCGSISAAGSFATPKIVPYALPVTPTSTASIDFQAVSIADPKVIFQPAAIGVASTIQLSMAAPNSIPVLIEKAVDFTPNAGNGNVTLMNDTNQGVTLSITGTCFDPPNFVTSPSTIRCGSFNGNQTSSPPLYSYTAPSVVPLAAAAPAASLGTAQRAVITITATSVADPVHTASTTFSISSNISFTVPLGTDAATMKNTCNPNAYSPTTDANFLADIMRDPCGLLVQPLSPTLAVGFPATFVESTQQGFGTVTGLTWVSSAGVVQPGSGSQTTFTAPASSGSVTITGYAIADFTKKATFSIPVVLSKVIPDNIMSPFSLTVPKGQASGSIALDFLGPTSGQITFGCSGFVSLPNSTCAFSPNPSNATGTTVVTMTLSVIRAGVTAPRAPRTPLPGLPGALLATILLMFLILAFASGKWARLHWVHAPRWNTAIVAFVLCAVVLTWVVACNQFSQPAIPPPPITGVTSATGYATVTGTPTTGSSPSTDSLAVPASVQ